MDILNFNTGEELEAMEITHITKINMKDSKLITKKNLVQILYNKSI